MKKITLILSLLLVLFSISFIFASANQKPIEGVVIETNEDDADVSIEEVAIETREDDSDDRVPRDSYLAISDESIGSSGRRWDQPEGYNAYRIHVTNNRNEKLTVTVSYDNGNKRWSFEVPANDSRTRTVNNAWSGRHNVSFTTSSGALSGTISVRVSDENL